MITAGIDVGIENVKIVILKDGQVVGRGTGLSGGAKRSQNVEQVWNETLQGAKLTSQDVSQVVATGQGKLDVGFAKRKVTEPIADAKAARFLYPSARTVVDVGADQTRVITLDPEGKLLEVVINEKCYAGLGIYLKTIARTLGISLEEISNAPGYARTSVAVNDSCSVFAELDTLGLMNRQASREEIIQAIIDMVTVRINALLNEKIKPEPHNTVMVGGVTKNQAVVKGLKVRSGIEFLVPEDAEYAGALGAALIAVG